MRSWIQPGALVRLHPLDPDTDSQVVRVYAAAGTLVHIGHPTGKRPTAWIDESLIDVCVRSAR